MSNLVQSDELSNTDFYDSLLATEDRNLEYNTVPSQNFLTQETENSPFEINFKPLGKPILSIQSVQYISHDVIYITNNNDFLANNFTGRGTDVDPYLFNDFEITANHTHLIFIKDTTVYFNISNNRLNGVSGSFTGIYLSNVTNGYIESNEILSCSYGVQLSYTSNVNISANTVYDSKYVGIYLYRSTDIFVDSNNVNSNVHGISLTDSWGNKINRNWSENNSMQGIALYNSSYVDVMENTLLKNSQTGIYVHNSLEHDISHNVITYNNDTGIVLHNINGSTVNNNEMVGNLVNGMLLTNSHGNQVLYNAIYQNGANGISIINSNSNYIHHNDIFDNYGSTIYAPIRYSRLSEEDKEPNVIIGHIDYSIKGTTSGHGIFLDPSSGNIIEFNNIFRNSGSGAYLYDANNNKFNENVLTENGENGVFLENSNDNTLDGNIILYNGGSLLTSGYDAGTIKFSIQGTTSGHGIFLDPSNGNTIRNN